MSQTLELAHKIRNGEELTIEERVRAERIITLAAQLTYQKSGSIFITGYGGEMKFGLPDYVFIAPAYGADVQCTMTYKKVENKS